MANGFAPKVTSKGTELPLLNLKGKPYLQVAHRLVWFREEQPLGSITTEIVQLGEAHAVVKATISMQGVVVATGMKKETEENFPDFLEKAETGAIGRALAAAGFGTQFAPELDEGDRIVDSPIAILGEKAPAVPEPKSVGAAAASRTKDLTQLKEIIRNSAKILNDTKKLALAEFKTRYLAGVGKVDQLVQDQAEAIIAAIAKEFPDLKLS